MPGYHGSRAAVSTRQPVLTLQQVASPLLSCEEPVDHVLQLISGTGRTQLDAARLILDPALQAQRIAVYGITRSDKLEPAVLRLQ
mmetsp:Transcript_12226/g.25366  ORF Transcript_12226/g.25366 Transcript_12226/m.25366 type:complete len:85 (-) Transcript_12226:747-1001(-)